MEVEKEERTKLFWRKASENLELESDRRHQAMYGRQSLSREYYYVDKQLQQKGQRAKWHKVTAAESDASTAQVGERVGGGWLEVGGQAKLGESRTPVYGDICRPPRGKSIGGGFFVRSTFLCLFHGISFCYSIIKL